MPQAPKNLREFAALVEVVQHLRGPEGCPWDKEQTPRSLTPYAIEESHELAEAIESGNTAAIKDELGDLLLQVVLHAQIAAEANDFNIQDVVENLNAKMIRRHPHVFGDTQVQDSSEVLKNWEQIKKTEKKAAPKDRFDIPVSLSALTRAAKIGNKTKFYNFDWKNSDQVFLKVEEELSELREAIHEFDRETQSKELGDLLFSVAQLARHLQIEPEQALREMNLRFEKRFFTMQRLAEQRAKDFSKLTSDELEELWVEAKKLLSDS